MALPPLAAAQPAPSLKLPPERSVFRPEIQPDLDRCSQEAVAKGVFGDVAVDLRRSPRPEARGTPGLGPHRASLEECVRAVMVRLLELERTSPQVGRSGWPRDVEIHLGRPRALLPPPDLILPAWQAHVDAAPDAAGATRAALARLLPPDVSVRPDRCLVAGKGAHVWQGLLLWLDQLGGRVSPFWDRLFDPELLPARPEPVLICYPDRPS